MADAPDLMAALRRSVERTPGEATAAVPDPSGGPWTRHGHPIPGVTVTGTHRPANVARCGGPALCQQCRYDVDTRTLVGDVLARAEERAVTNTATVPDEEARAHPLHAVITAALRWPGGKGRAPADRIWGRWYGADHALGAEGNLWAGDPEDVADHLVRAIVNHLPVVAGRYVIAPLLPSVATELERLARLPILAHGQADVPASEPVTKPDTAGQVMRCEVCGCTDDRACPGGCWWARPGLCSRCTALVPE